MSSLEPCRWINYAFKVPRSLYSVKSKKNIIGVEVLIAGLGTSLSRSGFMFNCYYSPRKICIKCSIYLKTEFSILLEWAWSEFVLLETKPFFPLRIILDLRQLQF